MRNESEQNTTAIHIFSKFSEESAEEEHHIVEGVESMPEGRDNEHSHAVAKTWALSRDESAVVDVVL